VRWLIAAVLLSILVGAPTAHAAAETWSKQTLLEPTPPGFGTDFSYVNVAANKRGDAIAVWVRERYSDEGTTCCDDERVIASYRPAGGVFGKPESISRLGDEATDPSAAIDSKGNAFVGWTIDDTESDLAIAPGGAGVAIRRAGRRHFDPPRLLSRGPAAAVLVVAGPRGQAVATWQKLVRGSWGGLDPSRLMAAVQSGPARFSRPHPLSKPTAPIGEEGDVAQPQSLRQSATIDPHGTTYVSWVRADGTSHSCCEAVEVSRRGPGGEFESPQRASEPAATGVLSYPSLASSAAGALLAWDETPPAGCCGSLVTRDWPRGAQPGAPVRSDLPHGSHLTALGMGDDGAATALVGAASPDGTTLGFTLSATRRPAGGTFGPLQELARGGSEGALTVDPDGSAHALWTRYTRERCDRYSCEPAGPRIDAADSPAGDGFADATTIGSRDGGTYPVIAPWSSGSLAGWMGLRGPWVAGRGVAVGPAPILHPVRGPVLSHFKRRGRRLFSFRVSKPARVVIEIDRDSDGEPVRLVGNASVRAHAGADTIVLPRRLARRLGPHQYEASLIAEDASGHDSRSIAPLVFRGVPSRRAR
jgi:hypothetical protein